MSHDLAFEIQNSDGTVTRPEIPLAGELDHLPDHAQQQTGSSFGYISETLKQSSHPTVLIFHCLFKTAAILLYFFGGVIVGSGAKSGANFIGLAVACILLLAADFWVVKNVTGRLLVGLRWWNKVDNDSTTWIFESAAEVQQQDAAAGRKQRGPERVFNRFDRNVFWTVLYVTPLIWVGFFLLAFIKFQLSWLIIVVMALFMNLANVYGYYKCSSHQQQRVQQMMQQGAQQGALAVMRAGMLNMFTGSGGGGTTTNTSSWSSSYTAGSRPAQPTHVI